MNSIKQDLMWAMRYALTEQTKSNKVLTESVIIESTKFIQEDATYEQLLNLVYNPKRDEKYLSQEVLESVVLQEFTGKWERTGPSEFSFNKYSVTGNGNGIISKANEWGKGKGKQFNRNMQDKAFDTKYDAEMTYRASQPRGERPFMGNVRTAENNNNLQKSLKIANRYEKVGEIGNKVMSNIGTIGAVTTAVAAAAFIYKRFFSKASRACTGKSGPARSQCIKKFKIDAIKTTIAQLSKDKAAKMSKAKDPKTKAKIANNFDNQIAKWKAKLYKASR